MMSRRAWRNRLLAGTLSTLVVSGLGLVGSIENAEALAPAAVTRVAGIDRFQTARLTAEEAFPGGATDAVLARGDLFPDALAGSYLAGLASSPILLTGSASLHPEALLGLTNLNVTTVHVLGSEAAVSEAVVDQLEAEGFTVDRIGGIDRFDTAAEVARAGGPGAVGTLGGFGRTAFVASGRNFPDALAAGPLSYDARFPILLTDPNALPATTEQALTDLGIQHVILVGGTTAVSDAVKGAIEANGITVDRRFGPDRFATAANLADFASDSLNFDVKQLVLATGANFPDAVAAGPLGGVLEAPIVLTADPLPDPSAKVCADNQPTVVELLPLGSPAVVSDAAVDACKALVEAVLPPPPPPPPVLQDLAGYVWANDPTAGSYSPSLNYQFNSEGGANTIVRNGTGNYTVIFPDLGVDEGTVAVTAYGTSGAECHVQTWQKSGPDLRVRVRCYDPAGAAVDHAFTASFQRRVPGSPGNAAYVWANDADAPAPYVPPAAYQFNSSGASNVVERLAVGSYVVVLPNLANFGGHVQVTSYGSGTTTCTIETWVPILVDQHVFVRCFDTTGAAADSRFTLQWVDGTNLLPTGTASAYLWADQPASAAYNPSPGYSFNSAGNVNSITRSGVGVYHVTLPGVESIGGHVQVTAYGTDADQCKVQSWTATGVVNVRCHTTNGALTDSRFTLSWTA